MFKTSNERRKPLMKTALISAILLLFAVPVLAVTYEWVDNQGTVNFTEDLGSIPQQYRKNAKVLGAEVASPESEALKDEPKSGTEAGGKRATTEQRAVGSREQAKMYGGKSADTWKRDFAQINGNIAAEEDQLSELKERIKDTSKMSRGEYLSIQMGINATESRLQRLRGKLEALTAEANRADVPADLRGR
jgi:hypothetical protein